MHGQITLELMEKIVNIINRIFPIENANFHCQ